ncbi:MAG TPA: DUF1761 domain-containing protein [Thermoanaerobaculia bacterium]|nr:DUF1761 domain-containing protein [Thermoanaerobaculia bacterium]
MTGHINWLAVFLAALSAFLLGGLWYSKLLFLNAWQRHSGAPVQAGHPGKVFGASFIFALISAIAFSALLGYDPTPMKGLIYGAVVGFAFVAASFGINYSFAQKSATLWAIDGGYHTVQFILYGLIIGALQ